MKIEGKKLSKAFGEKVLFQDLDFVVESGKVTAIIGMSGCGKSTLLNIIGLIEACDKGEVLYDGQKIEQKKIRKFRADNITYIFQNYGLIENETVLENLKIMKHNYTKSEFLQRVQQALKTVDLEGFENKKIIECSGGEQQRVAIAKAIIKESQIILADEPTASLDEENKKIVMNLLKKYANLNKCVILVTHDQSILSLCDATIALGE